jgi:hypothetical protein
MKPVILFRKNHANLDEFEVAKKYFDVVQYRTLIPENSVVFGRFSTIPFYNEVDADVFNRKSILINSIEQASFIADFNWYEVLENYTFKTWFRAVDLPDDGTKFVVKGRTNSRKHEWNKLMFAENKRQAIEIMTELHLDPQIGPQGCVFRKYEPLVTFEIGNNGLPFTNEFRFFFYKGEIVAYGYYWTMAQDVSKKLTIAGLEFAKEMGRMLKDYANFYVIDIAEKAVGGWIVVEVNDAQMSGLCEIPADDFYGNLAALVKYEKAWNI